MTSWVGIDVAKHTYWGCAVDEEGDSPAPYGMARPFCELTTITDDVVEAARSTLAIGAT